MNSTSAFNFFLHPVESSAKLSINAVLQQLAIGATSMFTLQYLCALAKLFPAVTWTVTDVAATSYPLIIATDLASASISSTKCNRKGCFSRVRN